MPVGIFDGEEASVFESLRSYAGVLFRLEDHLDRLFASAKTAGLAIPYGYQDLEAILYEALRRSGSFDAFLRLTWMAGSLFVIVTQRGHPPSVFELGISLRTATTRKSASRASYPEAKTSNYGAQVLATVEASEDMFELLFLGDEGTVRECRTSNLFIVKKRRLMTPPAVGVLEGVTRRTVMECARELVLPCREIPFTRHDVFNADEAFITHTSGELVPVRELDGRRIGREVPGAWTRRLSQRFRGKVKEYQRERHRA